MSFEDYFNAVTLDIEERRYIKTLLDILTILFIHKPKHPVNNINKYLDKVHKDQTREYQDITNQIIKRMNGKGYKIKALPDLVRVNKFKYSTFLLHVNNPLEVILGFITLIECSVGFIGKFDYICMIPFFNNSRWHDKCHILGNINFDSLLVNDPETMNLIFQRDIPAEIIKYLYGYKIKPIPVLELFNYHNEINDSIQYVHILYSLVEEHLSEVDVYAEKQRNKIEQILYDKIKSIKELANIATNFIKKESLGYDTEKLVDFYNEVMKVDDIENLIRYTSDNKIELNLTIE
jgi:hypothetical protein